MTCSRGHRIGSGSACRSVYGGFVKWLKGQAEDGSDSVAQQVSLGHPRQAGLFFPYNSKDPQRGEGGSADSPWVSGRRPGFGFWCKAPKIFVKYPWTAPCFGRGTPGGPPPPGVEKKKPGDPPHTQSEWAAESVFDNVKVSARWRPRSA